MSDVFLILLVLGVLGLAAGVFFGGALEKIVHSRKDCPLCWESIPAEEKCARGAKPGCSLLL